MQKCFDVQNGELFNYLGDRLSVAHREYNGTSKGEQ